VSDKNQVKPKKSANQDVEKGIGRLSKDGTGPRRMRKTRESDATKRVDPLSVTGIGWGGEKNGSRKDGDGDGRWAMGDGRRGLNRAEFELG
jgi:hypothetical protein